MRLAVISDIHGNLPALKAVLEAIPSVDGLLCAGDVVGYYPDINEVCDILRVEGAFVVRGNHDAYVIGELHPDICRRALYRTDWTLERLSTANLKWLKSLPIEIRFRFGECNLTMRHASPWDEVTYLYPDSDSLRRLSLMSGDILIVGHTHRHLWRPVGAGWILNPGSVGQPRDYDYRPCFAIIDSKTTIAELCRVDYDVAGYQMALREKGWDESTINMLNRKRQI